MNIRLAPLEDIWLLRQKVMWPDKDIGFVKLEDDPAGTHYGFYVEDQLTSVVSLFLEGDDAQFRKFATLQEQQGKGYGSKLLQFTLEEAKRQGARRIWCNARANKVDYYAKFGLQPTDESFEKAGVRYVILQRTF